MSLIYNKNSTLFKFFSIFSVVRIYNLCLIIIAQYLTSIYILSDKKILDVVFDYKLFLIIICSSISIASGYIINNFYDEKKDIINKPIKYKIDGVIKNSTKLYFYFSLNFLVIIVSYFLIDSIKAVIFFSIYIFFLWLYSHKLKRILFLSNLFYSLLTITPFFAILIYFKNFDFLKDEKISIIIAYALFLFFILLLKDFTKDLKNLKGDFILNYKTIPVVFGESFAKVIITMICFINLLLIANLYMNFSNGFMNLYYIISFLLLIVFIVRLYSSNRNYEYLSLHNILRFIITLGVFSIILIGI
tara:strand:+ start:1720 stop:2628 length:909 start_codon:yes stop_codon:yes gene_type:complete